MRSHRVVILVALAVVVTVPSASYSQPAAGGTGITGRGVDVTILLDASTSMAPAWDQCRAHLPVLLDSLQAGDCLRVIVFGRAEDVRTVVNQTIASPADIAAIEKKLAEINCDLRGSIMSVGLRETYEGWADGSMPKVFIVVTDGIVYPPAGRDHDAEWAARWETARPIRRDPSVHRVIFGVRTKEPGAKSLERLGEALLPQQVLMLGEDDLEEFRAGLADLRRVVDQARIPPSAQTTPAADVPASRKNARGRWVLWAGLCFVAALVAKAVGIAIKRRVVAGADEAEPVAGALSVKAWMLDDRLQRTGTPETWRFEVPLRRGLELSIGGPDHAHAGCRVTGVELLSPDPLLIRASRNGCHSVVVPSFETVLVKDDVPGFNPDARCLDEELYRRLDAGAEPRLCAVRGQTALVRVLPGRNELELSFSPAALLSGPNTVCADGLLTCEEAQHDQSA